MYLSAYVDFFIVLVLIYFIHGYFSRKLQNASTSSTSTKKSPNVRKKSESSMHHGEYSTDTGLIVPGLSSNLRNRLFAAAEANGISKERLVELVARSTSEVTIQLLGGSHRLNPLNSHQVYRHAKLKVHDSLEYNIEQFCERYTVTKNLFSGSHSCSIVWSWKIWCLWISYVEALGISRCTDMCVPSIPSFLSATH